MERRKKEKKKEGFHTKKEAKEYEYTFKSTTATHCNIKFQYFIEIYMKDCTSRLKQTTMRSKQYMIETHIIPYFSEYELSSITPVIIRKWQVTLLTKDYSQTYLKTLHTQLSAILNYACKYYQLSINPIHLCESIGSSRTATIQFWTYQEFYQFQEVIQDIKDKTIFHTLFWTGMRIGELQALTLEDLDLEGNIILIQKNYARLHRKDIITEPKTPKSKRSIAIPDFLNDILQVYLSDFSPEDSFSRIFPVSKDYLYHKMRRYSTLSGIKNIKLHSFRHSHASQLIELGFSPLLISERLGHESVQTTLRIYSHLYPNKQMEIVEKLESLHSTYSENN